MTSKITFVTGLWDINRHSLKNGFERKFDEYIEYLKQFINEVNVPLFLYTTEDIARQLPVLDRLVVQVKSLEELQDTFEFRSSVEKIRNNPSWINQDDWLKDSPQAALPNYNIITLSKYFLLNDVTIHNPFNSEYFYWIDAGIARTLGLSYLSNSIVDKIPKIHNVNDLLMLSYPYTGNTEIHGFDRSSINNYCNVNEVTYVCRGGFFGGSKKAINKYNSTYWSLLDSTLKNGLMGTEESIFTIMAYTELNIHRHDIGDSGLIYNFFEHVKHEKVSEPKQSLYVLSYNSPKQFQELINSFEEIDSDFLNIPSKYLINNSTDHSFDIEYERICSVNGFEEIKFDNIGINGGRQFVAEHFATSDSDHYIFFEDDMTLAEKGVDQNGFNRHIQDLYKRSLEIITQDDLDYLKLSFSEFFGDNSVQFAWYNIPADMRLEHFPDNSTLPVSGMSPNPPKTKFETIKISDGLPYAIGQVYYCNWPIWFSRKGNQKMFLDDKFERPYEQTWMSRSFGLHVKNELKTAVLLASPIYHDRFDHYSGGRKEN